MEVLEYPSGQAVWDWEIPPAWDVNEAYIEDSKGNRLVDFADSNLHLSAYSIPFDGEVSREELLRHLCWLEDRPSAIPYNYLYYRRDWQFNIAYDRLGLFTDDRYHVRIDVDLMPGTLKVGCCHLPGRVRPRGGLLDLPVPSLAGQRQPLRASSRPSNCSSGWLA